jgi:hypothetical protein
MGLGVGSWTGLSGSVFGLADGSWAVCFALMIVSVFCIGDKEDWVVVSSCSETVGCVVLSSFDSFANPIKCSIAVGKQFLAMMAIATNICIALIIVFFSNNNELCEESYKNF